MLWLQPDTAATTATAATSTSCVRFLLAISAAFLRCLTQHTPQVAAAPPELVWLQVFAVYRSFKAQDRSVIGTIGQT
jgi:hypothetical protein